jgi:hypothetical protein
VHRRAPRPCVRRRRIVATPCGQSPSCDHRETSASRSPPEPWISASSPGDREASIRTARSMPEPGQALEPNRDWGKQHQLIQSQTTRGSRREMRAVLPVDGKREDCRAHRLLCDCHDPTQFLSVALGSWTRRGARAYGVGPTTERPSRWKAICRPSPFTCHVSVPSRSSLSPECAPRASITAVS